MIEESKWALPPINKVIVNLEALNLRGTKRQVENQNTLTYQQAWNTLFLGANSSESTLKEKFRLDQFRSNNNLILY